MSPMLDKPKPRKPIYKRRWPWILLTLIAASAICGALAHLFHQL